MKKKTFKIVKVVSLLMGFFYIGGFIWFGEYFLSKPFYFIFFIVSTGLALLITPLITDTMLKSIVIRLIAALLVIIGIIHNIYMIIDVFLTSRYFVDAIDVIIQQLIILFVLVIILRRIINPKLED